MRLMAYNKTKKQMKKLVLVLLAVLMCSVSFAQFRAMPKEAGAPMPTKTLSYGQVTPFTCTSIDNQTIDIQSWLDSGYYVLVDISATWCSWCWYLHTSGTLETLYNRYGPNGTNEMRVVWIEGDPSTNHASLYSGGMGDWTNGNTVPYPIAEMDDVEYYFSQGVSGFPTVNLICPSGYYQDAYAVCDWSGSAFIGSQSATNIYNLITTCPAAGDPPIIEIDGLNTVVVGSPATFTANYVSVDPVTSVEWTLTGATPATATGDVVNATWSATGNYTVTLAVTNTSGTTTETLDVRAIEWNWGDEMSYTLGGSYVSSIGASGTITWGAKYPAAFMAGRNYIENVKVYANEAAHYTLDIYQTNPGANPTANDMLYEYTYAVTAGDNTLPMYDQIALNSAKDLWISFTCSDASYPAAGTDFSGDPNGSLICFNGAWTPVYEVNESLLYTWMIGVTTSETAPAMNIAINGPQSTMTNVATNFAAFGPAAATYSWTFANGTPATATGSNVSTTWTTAGTFAVTVTATLNGETATASMNVNVADCSARNLPFTCGFEASDNFTCWNFVDVDGDGYSWDLDSWAGSQYVHGGNGAIGTASYINNIGVLYPDQWMITPELVIPDNGANLTFYVGGISEMYGDKYSIYVSTTGPTPSDFTANAPIFTETPTNANFSVKHVDLCQYAGQTIRLGFRHYESVDGYWLIFDDLTVAAGQNAINDVNDINVALYPNPTTSKLNITAEGIQEINVLDINGRVVMTANNTNVIDMSELSNGCYFVRVITNEGVSTQKIVKK